MTHTENNIEDVLRSMAHERHMQQVTPVCAYQ